jgi:hypothetical protein
MLNKKQTIMNHGNNFRQNESPLLIQVNNVTKKKSGMH